jgi:hypothetical protein
LIHYTTESNISCKPCPAQTWGKIAKLKKKFHQVRTQI